MEAELRAAVIVAIMRFTAWPAPVSDTETSLRVCLAGRPSSAEFLLPISGQQKVAGRTLEVHTVTLAEINTCQVLILGAALDSVTFSSLVAAADDQATLSVCDGCRYDQSSEAIIHLTLRKQRVNFEVNLAKAKSNGVALDAQLLELASVVRK